MNQIQILKELKDVYNKILYILLNEIKDEDLYLLILNNSKSIKEEIKRDFYKTKSRFEFEYKGLSYYITYQISETCKGKRVKRNEICLHDWFEIKLHRKYNGRNKRLFCISTKNYFLKYKN